MATALHPPALRRYAGAATRSRAPDDAAMAEGLSASSVGDRPATVHRLIDAAGLAQGPAPRGRHGWAG